MLIVVVHLGLGRFSIQNLPFFVSLKMEDESQPMTSAEAALKPRWVKGDYELPSGYLT